MLFPKIWTSPFANPLILQGINPLIAYARVDFPLPLGPAITKTSPLFNWKVILDIAGV